MSFMAPLLSAIGVGGAGAAGAAGAGATGLLAAGGATGANALAAGATAGGMGGAMGAASALGALPAAAAPASQMLAMTSPQLSMLTSGMANPAVQRVLNTTAGSLGSGVGAGASGLLGNMLSPKGGGGLITSKKIASVAQAAQTVDTLFNDPRRPQHASMGSPVSVSMPKAADYYSHMGQQGGMPKYALGHSDYWRKF